MRSDKIEELMDIYETLVDAGVTFYYEDEEIFTVEVKDFINNHSKEGMNYHCFETVRKFDKLLN